jgi:putative FmdB family regulatory protein
MPIYEYRCEKCGEVSEVLIFDKGETPACQACGSTDLTKLMSAHNTTSGSSPSIPQAASGSCCGSPNSCGMPGSCCSN